MRGNLWHFRRICAIIREKAAYKKVYFFVSLAGEGMMTQLEIIQQALRQLGGKAPYSQIYCVYEEITGSPLTPGTKAGLRKCIELHSSDSDNFSGKQDVFYSVEGKGKGVWGLR